MDYWIIGFEFTVLTCIFLPLFKFIYHDPGKTGLTKILFQEIFPGKVIEGKTND